MHLKKLEIQGFKSFPEYTLIEFDKGMTAVVGPNGSGKSNITDAVRWVLGEQSVKSLRGGKMEDVIFNGTQSRKQMHYAEVSMILDNSDHFVNYDFDELQITRRLYRSGESEYQINHVNCRLKDIVSLFLDTGLGKDGYSFVGQGRVDEILSSKSEDRRRVLEEASGIVKYKVRKEEAERKLKSTEQNLVRINDILNELEERIEPLKAQSEKAIKYHKIYDELKHEDIALMVHKINVASEAMGGSSDMKAKLEEDLKNNEDLFVKIKNDNQEISNKIDRMEQLIEDERQKLSDITEESHDLKSDVKVAQDKILYLNSRSEEIKQEKSGLELKISELKAEYQKNQDKADEILGEIRNEDKLSEGFAAEIAQISGELSAFNKEQDDLKRNIEQKTSELISHKEQVNYLNNKIESLNDRLDELGNRRVDITKSTEELKKQLDSVDKTWHNFINEVGSVSSDIFEREEKLKEVDKEFIHLNSLYEQDNNSFIATKTKLRTLEDMDLSKNGYQESVRKLCDFVKGGIDEKKIVGILGDLISTKKEYETAIEIALGSSIHNVVTRDEQDAASLINVLKDNRLGRVTFLPIENIRARYIDDDQYKKIKDDSGFIGIASDLVDNDSDLNDIVSNLLGRIVISKNMDSARRIASSIRYQLRIITLEGDSINPGGSLTGGSIRKNATGILGRAREIEELKNKCQKLEQKLASNEDERQEIDERRNVYKKEISQLEEQLKYFEIERVKAENEFKTLKNQIEDYDKQIININQNIEDLSKERLKFNDDLEEITLVINESEGELSDFRESIIKTDSKNKTIIDKIEDLKDKLNKSKIESERMVASRNGIMNTSTILLREKNNFEANLADKTKESDEILKQIEELNLEVEKSTEILQKFTSDIDLKQKEIDSLFKQREALDADASEYTERITGLTDTIYSIRNELNLLTSKYEKYINDIDFCKNHLWEEYELSYDNVKETAGTIEEENKSSRRISQLKSQIKDIGPVNLNSVDEYKEVLERYEFNKSQRDDIVQAISDLNKVIADLLEEMRTQFVKHFEVINENFKKVFFDLFNGGTAEILLENEDDVLNSNIDIKAQPPGKKLQALSLLSGGERCLTAIALLFAILQLRPTPFVILDEVEAALDEVNVVRFTDFVRSYTSKSQFILVTHRKGTMEACDRMYGVAMQEKGISKVLSMRLSDKIPE